MKRRAIVEALGDIKHRLQADRNQLMRIGLHLRDYHRTTAEVQYETVRAVIDEVEKFNSERLGNLLEMVNELIEKEDV